MKPTSITFAPIFVQTNIYQTLHAYKLVNKTELNKNVITVVKCGLDVQKQISSALTVVIDLLSSLHTDLRIIKCEQTFVRGDGVSKKNLPPVFVSFFFSFVEDVYRFPGSGPVMDSNAAKEIIHSCPITTYEAPINTRSPGLGGRPGSCWEQGGRGGAGEAFTDQEFC